MTTKLTYPQCGLVFSPPNYDWKACTQQFRKHENIDTRLQLKMGENRNETKTHWAYGPYLTLARNPWALIKVTLLILLFSNGFYIVSVGSGSRPSQPGRLYSGWQIQ